MFGFGQEDPIMQEHLEDIRDEDRRIPRIECDECGHALEPGETYSDIDGYYYCEMCMDRHMRVRS